MEPVVTTKQKSYGVNFTNDLNGVTLSEIFQYDGLMVKLPVGEILFSVLETFIRKDEIITDSDYDLQELFDCFSLSGEELKKLSFIDDYLNDIANRSKEFNARTLKELFIKLFPRGLDFYYLFHSSDRYRIRRVFSKLTLPFGVTTYQIFEELRGKYLSFSFSTQTEVHLLSELCALSLFEILESGQMIHRCSDCHRYFVGAFFCGDDIKKGSSLCSRPALYNEHKGCKQHKISNYNREYRKKQSVVEYKRIYNRLQARAIKRPTLDNVKNFKDFQREWALLRISLRHSPEYEKKKMEFLQLERWK